MSPSCNPARQLTFGEVGQSNKNRHKAVPAHLARIWDGLVFFYALSTREVSKIPLRKENPDGRNRTCYPGLAKILLDPSSCTRISSSLAPVEVDASAGVSLCARNEKARRGWSSVFGEASVSGVRFSDLPDCVKNKSHIAGPDRDVRDAAFVKLAYSCVSVRTNARIIIRTANVSTVNSTGVDTDYGSATRLASSRVFRKRYDGNKVSKEAKSQKPMRACGITAGNVPTFGGISRKTDWVRTDRHIRRSRQSVLESRRLWLGGAVAQ